MRTMLALASVLGLAVAGETQVMLLIDASQFGVIKTDFPTMIAETMEAMVEDGSYSFAVSHFTDKPAPYSGVGVFGDYPGGYTEDYCYANSIGFTKDPAALKNAVLSIKQGAGLDAWEAQFEALIRGVVDTSVGWKDDAEKVVLLVTDSFGHSLAMDTLASHVEGFNEPVRCMLGTTKGGFGAKEGWNVYGWIHQEALYNEYQELHYKRACVEDLTAAEQTRYNELLTKFPVRKYPAVRDYSTEVLKSNPDEHCRYHEYPFYDDVVEAFAELGAKLFVMFHDPSGVSSYSYSDQVVWTWALSDTWALADLTNVWEEIPNLSAIVATDKDITDGTSVDSFVSLESIIRDGVSSLVN